MSAYHCSLHPLINGVEIIRLDARPIGSSRRRPRCRATTSTGRPCRNIALPGSEYCRVHESQSSRARHPASEPEPFDDPVQGHEGEGLETFIRRRLSGDYEVDDFGYDPHLARQLLLPLARPLYENYFRVKTLGIDRIPDTGPALIVANHSGTVALDAVMVQYAVATEYPQKRAIRNIGADLVFQLPFVGPMARKTGNAVACDEDAHELLRLPVVHPQEVPHDSLIAPAAEQPLTRRPGPLGPGGRSGEAGWDGHVRYSII